MTQRSSWNKYAEVELYKLDLENQVIHQNRDFGNLFKYRRGSLNKVAKDAKSNPTKDDQGNVL